MSQRPKLSDRGRCYWDVEVYEPEFTRRSLECRVGRHLWCGILLCSVFNHVQDRALYGLHDSL